ncbi:DUF6000 family protein [Streptomyces sp. NPDC059355]|uniref:DUF6000 family protein n=1 Tax=Streptomyces sp. NPDC059355 TaxID=3346811 RepID=UPI0036C99F0B
MPASEVCCAGGAYCVALASFGTARDADLLAAYLDRCLRLPDLAYDRPTAMGALAHTDSVLHGDACATSSVSRSESVDGGSPGRTRTTGRGCGRWNAARRDRAREPAR